MHQGFPLAESHLQCIPDFADVRCILFKKKSLLEVLWCCISLFNLETNPKKWKKKIRFCVNICKIES